MRQIYVRRYIKEFADVMRGKTSLEAYLARNYPSLFKIDRGKVIRWKGIPLLSDAFHEIELLELIILNEIYSIPECRVEKEDVVFDVGAHLGFFTFSAFMSGAARVYAFEPNPFAFDILKKHTELWKVNADVFNLALYSEETSLELFIPSNPVESISTVLKDRKRTVLEKHRYGKSVLVNATTLDRFVERNNVERVDFIKIDAEGAEREIIKGAKETIKKFKPRMAIAAYHLPDDKKVIPELVLSIRDDYKYKLVNKGEEDLFFF